MPDNSNPQIEIGVAINAATGPGADQAIADVNRVKAQTVEATAATEAATEEVAVAQSRARQVADEYRTSIFVAAQALTLLGEASSTAAIGSAEMDAAIESATRSTIAASEQRAAYTAQLRASTEAMLAEMAALDENAAAEEKRTVLTEAVTAALQRMGLTEAEVTAQAQKLNASYEGTARAMLQIKQAELATEVSAIRAELEGTSVAATESASGLEQVGAQLAQRGEQRHILTSIREIAQGGALAIRGEAEATFLLGNALDALVPGVGVFVAIASGVALVTDILEQHSAKVQDAADKAKGKVEDADSSSKAYAEDLKGVFGEMEKSAGTAFNSVGEMYQNMIAQAQAATNATKELQRAQDELKSAKLAAQIAQLDAAEEKEEEGKTPDQQAAIKRQYTAKRLNLRQQFDEDEAIGKVASAQSDLAQAQSALTTKSKELADEESKYEDLLKDADNASQGLASNNVPSDAEYAESQRRALWDKRDKGTATQDDLAQLNALEDSVPLLRQKENESGKSFDQTSTRLKAKLDADTTTAQAHPDEAVGARAAAEAEDIKDQLRAIAYYQSAVSALADGTKANAKDQLDGRAALTELKGKVDALTILVQAAQGRANALGVVDATQMVKLQQADADADAKHAFEMRQAQREADIKNLQAQSANPLATPDQRAADKAKADQISAAGDRDKLANANALGLSDADRIRLGGDASSSQTKAQNIIVGQNQKDSKAQFVDAQKALDAAEKSAEAAARSHPELLRGIKGIAQVTTRNAVLIVELTNTLDPVLQSIGRRLQNAEDSVANLRRAVLSTH